MNRGLIALLLVAAVQAHAQTAGMQRISPAGPAAGVQPVAAPELATPEFQQAKPAGVARGPRGVAPMPTPMPQAPNLVDQSLTMLAPLTAQEILQLRAELTKRQRAAAQPLAPQGKPSTRLARIDLSPGATPEVIRISTSEGAVVSFIDAAGRPWPVENADNFNPTAFDIASFGPNAISVAGKINEAVGNIAVRLSGMSGALTFKVLSGHSDTRNLDYAVDLEVPRYLPGAPAPVGEVITQTPIGVSELMNYLLRTPPRDARELKIVSLPGAMAWQTSSGRLMLRTDRMVLSPNAARRQSSSDGMTVYDLPLTPVVLVADGGRMVNIQVDGISVAKDAKK